jgi:hypothetical protein
VPAAIPVAGDFVGGHRREHAGESFGPGVLDIQRDCIGQEALEQFRRFLRRIECVEPIFFGDTEIMPITRDLIDNAAALFSKSPPARP